MMIQVDDLRMDHLPPEVLEDFRELLFEEARLADEQGHEGGGLEEYRALAILNHDNEIDSNIAEAIIQRYVEGELTNDVHTLLDQFQVFERMANLGALLASIKSIKIGKGVR